MKKSKSGFTLVEMIVVIAIIAVLSIVLGMSASMLSQNAKDTNNEAVMKELLNAGYLYCQLSSHKNECNNDNVTITINNLIESGLLNEKYNEKVVNPVVGNSIKFTKEDYVTVVNTDGERDVIYSYNDKKYKLSSIDGCSKSRECHWGNN